MPAFTPNLNLYKPGGGSTGLILPDEVADIDRLNANFDILDAAVGDPDERNVRWTGPAAQINSLPDSPKDGDEYQESDGNKALWRRMGGVWGTYENGMILLRPSSVAGCVINPDGSLGVTGTNTAWSVNGVFSSRFRKYRVEFFMRCSAATSVVLRLRNAGSDYATANYAYISLESNGSAVTTLNPGGQAYWPLNNGSQSDVWGTIGFTNPAHGGTDMVKAYEAVANGHIGGWALAMRNGYIATVDNSTFDGFTIFTTGGTFQTSSWLKVYAVA